MRPISRITGRWSISIPISATSAPVRASRCAQPLAAALVKRFLTLLRAHEQVPYERFTRVRGLWGQRQASDRVVWDSRANTLCMSHGSRHTGIVLANLFRAVRSALRSSAMHNELCFPTCVQHYERPAQRNEQAVHV